MSLMAVLEVFIHNSNDIGECKSTGTTSASHVLLNPLPVSLPPWTILL